jgi:hypothetical protein
MPVWAGLLVAAALSACHGPGDEEDEASAPVLTQTTPADKEVDTARNASVMADFDVDLDSGSVDSTTAWISGPEGNTIPASASVEGHRLTLTPAVPLPGGTTYTVTLGAGLKSAAGGELGNAKALRFTTKAQAWQAELSVASESDGFEDWLWPEATADEKGNVLVAWVQPDGDTSRVTAVRLEGVTGTWGETAVFRTASYLVDWPRVFTAPDGDARLVWSEGGADGITAYIASYRGALGTWSTPVRLEGVPAATLSVTPLVERNGTITLVCHTVEHLLVTRFDAVQARWSEPIAIEQAVEGRLIHTESRLAADAAGNVLLAWRQVDEGSDRPIYATRFDTTARTWTAAQMMAADARVGGLAPQSMSFALDLVATGHATMAWSTNAEVPAVVVARFDSTTSHWTQPETIAQGWQPSAVVDDAGYTTVVWQQENGLHASRRGPADSAWKLPVRIADRAPYPGSTEAPQLATDIAGNVTAVYGEPGSGTWIKASRYSVDTGEWSIPQSIDTTATETLVFPWGSPVAAIDASGTVTAAWLAYRETFGSAALATNRLR